MMLLLCILCMLQISNIKNLQILNISYKVYRHKQILCHLYQHVNIVKQKCSIMRVKVSVVLMEKFP
jgi:hypothetical protein